MVSTHDDVVLIADESPGTVRLPGSALSKRPGGPARHHRGGSEASSAYQRRASTTSWGACPAIESSLIL